MNAEQEANRIAVLEAEADRRAYPGPCLICGKHRDVLLPGRVGGLRVYCEICAIGERTVSQRGKHPRE